MSLLDRLTKKTDAAPKKETTKKPAAKKATKAKAKDVESKPSAAKAVNLSATRLLIKPMVSEKAARLADAGTFVFVVPVSAEKISVRKAVEAQYGVNVERVNMVHLSGKPVRRGKRMSYRQDTKKALVTLKKGQTLSLYEGV